MDRAELERLDREGLVLRAQAAGVRRARLLTRPELVDELLRLDPAIDPGQLKKTRGFFGRAKDLLSRVVERGLHLPDAADRLRAALGTPLPNVPRPEPQAVPTVTLAEIYAAQGHKQRALDTLRRVLETEPEHGGARALLAKLEAVDYVAPEPPLPPETDETARDEIGGNLTAAQAEAEAEPESQPEPEPETVPTREIAVALAAESSPVLAIDECIAIPVHEDSSYVWWRLSPASRERVGEAFFFVRVVVLQPSWDGPEREIRDTVCDADAGELLVHQLPPGAVVRIAVGTMLDGAFVPLAHSPAIEVGASNALVQRTLEGVQPIGLDDPLAASVAVAAGRAAQHA
jgi:hypothetical protein